MHIDHAKADALEREIGPRGQTKITSKNRNLVRKWLCALDAPSPIVRALTLADLDRYYNSADSREQTAAYFNTTTKPEGPRMAAQPEDLFQPAPAPAQPQPAPQANGPDVNQVAALLTQLLGSGQRAPLDENRVIDLIREHAPIQRLEIKTPDGAVREIGGQSHRALPALLTMVSAGVNVWLAGPAGSGKTTMAEQVAEALDRPFYSTGAVTSDFRLMGFMNAHGELVRTPFRDAFEHGGVFLWDEVDASNPNALTAFNQALANGQYAFPDGMVKRHKDFVAIAAGNTYGHGPTAEYVGRTRIDAAFLDRFATLHIDYDRDLEAALVDSKFDGWVQTVHKLRDRVEENGIRHIIGTRAIVLGAKLLAAGMDEADVLSAVCRKGLDDDSWAKISR